MIHQFILGYLPTVCQLRTLCSIEW